MTGSWNDFNDARNTSIMPKGEIVKVRLTIRPGGHDDPAQGWTGGYATRGDSGAVHLNAEFTVLEGPYARRKIWWNYTVPGGKVDDKGGSKGWNIAKATFGAMLDSAFGLDWNDFSAANAKRQSQGLKQLDGITFAGRLVPASCSACDFSIILDCGGPTIPVNSLLRIQPFGCTGPSQANCRTCSCHLPARPALLD